MSRNDDERAAGRAECFARLVLAGQQDAHGRSLLDHAERLTERLAMYWEKEVGWLSASLGADRVDETTLMGVGFNIQQVRHATVVKPRAGESPGDYAERIAIYNEPDALAVATAMLEDAAAINPAVPIETTDAARRDAIERLGHAMEQWYEDNQQGKLPAGGGMADGQPTAPGLSAALLRMRHHTRMALLSLDEMSRGPSNRRWGIIERLDARDVLVFIDVAFEALRPAAAVVAETSVGTPAPATPADRQALKAARKARQTGLQAISATAVHVAGGGERVGPCVHQAAPGTLSCSPRRSYSPVSSHAPPQRRVHSSATALRTEPASSRSRADATGSAIPAAIACRPGRPPG